MLRAIGLALSAVALAGFGLAQPPEAGGNDGMQTRIAKVRQAEIQGAKNNGPAAGTPAPDFELTALKFYEFKTDKTEITRRNADQLYQPVKLSAFRGEKPVALIFGSYT